MGTGAVSISIEGLTKLLEKSAVARAIVLGTLAKALYNEGELIMGRSKDEFVPVDTGTLKSTGHVEPPVIQGEQVSVTMGYGGPAVDYALYVHEGTRHMEGRFYLERPAMEEAPHIPDRVKAKIALALEKL